MKRRGEEGGENRRRKEEMVTFLSSSIRSLRQRCYTRKEKGNLTKEKFRNDANTRVASRKVGGDRELNPKNCRG